MQNVEEPPLIIGMQAEQEPAQLNLLARNYPTHFHVAPSPSSSSQTHSFSQPLPTLHITSRHVMSGTVVQGDLAKLLITNPIRDCQFINHCISRVVILSLSALHFQHKTNYVFPAKNCNDYLLKSAQSGAALQQTAMVSCSIAIIKSFISKTKRMEVG